MYNLFIGYVGVQDEGDQVVVNAQRFLEHTDPETQIRYRNLKEDTIAKIMEYPALFMHEHCEGGAFVAHIKKIDIVSHDNGYIVTFQRNKNFNVIPSDDIYTLKEVLEISKYEFYRTHWAIKSCDLFQILDNYKISDADEDMPPVDMPQNKPADKGLEFNMSQVFIVHGHDEHAKNDAKKYVESRGLEPIILHLQASGGRTIIEKIDNYSNVGFAIVLYTECDTGAKRNTLGFKWRARQNVVFEHGYLIAKLKRERVAALVKGDIEKPTDISGIIYIEMDAANNWESELDTELQNVNYEIKSKS